MVAGMTEIPSFKSIKPRDYISRGLISIPFFYGSEL